MHEIYTKICSVLFVCRTHRQKKKIFPNEKNENKTKNIIYIYMYIVEKQRRRQKKKTKQKNDNSMVWLHFSK